jgi:hypothetical protein
MTSVLLLRTIVGPIACRGTKNTVVSGGAGLPGYNYSGPRGGGEKKFGFLTEAFKYGAPPHGGIAPGLDRLVMLMAGETSIKEVIAFPKNSFAVSPMDDSPSEVEPKQLEELHLRVIPPSKDLRE